MKKGVKDKIPLFTTYISQGHFFKKFIPFNFSKLCTRRYQPINTNLRSSKDKNLRSTEDESS